MRSPTYLELYCKFFSQEVINIIEKQRCIPLYRYINTMCALEVLYTSQSESELKLTFFSCSCTNSQFQQGNGLKVIITINKNKNVQYDPLPRNCLIILSMFLIYFYMLKTSSWELWQAIFLKLDTHYLWTHNAFQYLLWLSFIESDILYGFFHLIFLQLTRIFFILEKKT